MKYYYLQKTISLWEKTETEHPTDEEIIDAANEILVNFIAPQIMIEKNLTREQVNERKKPLAIIKLGTKKDDASLKEKVNEQLKEKAGVEFDLNSHVLVPVPTMVVGAGYKVVFAI